ncbi:hypothetical protein [Lactobacillus terrae]|uniref:hypothetical protein n=1 Tax=Lactobacillus terrae TaxID=2269374 RepID=UPI000C1B6093|nr:hypothetical protein [Lactobacillus terrae]
MNNKMSFIMMNWLSVLSIALTVAFFITTDNLIGGIIFIMIGIFQILYFTYCALDYYKSFIKK